MHDVRTQRVLIAFIREHAPVEYVIWRAELRREFAELIASMPNDALRRYYGQVYRERKAAMVVATARYISMQR